LDQTARRQRFGGHRRQQLPAFVERLLANDDRPGLLEDFAKVRATFGVPVSHTAFAGKPARHKEMCSAQGFFDGLDDGGIIRRGAWREARQ
ncbi:hypothetical protein Q6272_29550, partial [Klebsiella pneumoniae]|uniref:hypothetical protein n=1 Tax=Klebsiella pneumoniae TaxID=573 RepID=UPI00272FA195